MEIVYIAPSKIPSTSANSVHVMKMCQALSEKSVDIILFARKPQEMERQEVNVFNFYDISGDFEIYWPSLDTKYQSITYAIQSAIIARHLDPDLVYSRIDAGGYFSLLLDLPLVYESHQPNDNYMHRKIINSPNLSKLVVISNKLKSHYINNYDIRDESILVAHDAADDPPTISNKEINARDRFQIGYIGSLHTGKGMGLIVKLADRIDWADFHVIGGEEDEVSEWKRKSPANITYYGHIPHNKTHKYRQSFDVLIAPYQEEVYGVGGNTNLSQWMSPLKIFEYMASGNLILCSDLPVLREVLEDGVDSILCNPNEVDDWVNSLNMVRRHPELKSKIENNAREKFIKNFTWDMRAEKILSSID